MAFSKCASPKSLLEALVPEACAYHLALHARATTIYVTRREFLREPALYAASQTLKLSVN